MEEYDKTEARIRKVLITIIAICMCAACYMLGSIVERGHMDKEAVENENVVMANGMPLDAVQYAAPSWMPDARQVFRVTDRSSHACWWVIRTSDDKWIAMQINGKTEDMG